MAKKTVHIIFHAHLDPLWLWNWQAGLDEVLATTRSACERLEAHPELKYSQGEAWVYQQVERLDPDLFARVKAFVAAGRWELLGGWWTQPDCNFPDETGLRRQIAAGRDYFERTFGQFPHIGFNPDSFGHSAALPGLMRSFGQSHYVFMRPMPQEMTLPARLFRWRGYADGPEVTVFRIHASYCPQELTAEFVHGCCTDLPEGVQDTACFCGVGDHGGGPTEELIAQVKQLQQELTDVEIRFSTVADFFAAVERSAASLPLVVGELQFHAIGCYSVQRASKLALLQATQRLRQMETLLPAEAPQGETLAEHWRNVVFHQFHDTLGGTCLPSAYRLVCQQLGAAEAFAEEWLAYELRRRLKALPSQGGQRFVFLNASDQPASGWFEAEPWLGHLVWQPNWNIVDEAGQPVRFQRLTPEALVPHATSTRFAFRLELEPGEMRVLSLDAQGRKRALKPDGDTEALTGDAHCFGNLCGAAVSLYPPEMVVGNWDLALPDVISYPDVSDTWTHRQDRYPDTDADLPVWGVPVLQEDGPFIREVIQEGRIGNSRLLRVFRITSDNPDVELRLRVDWQERHRVLKLVMPYSGHGDTRVDGICAGSLERPQDGCERPVQRWTRLPLCEDEALSIVCPDVFALDATPQRVRFTLLRSCQLAHHDPTPGGRLDVRYSDRGEHDFRFRICAGQHTDAELDQLAYAMMRPLAYADLTR